jgi:anti-sigma factor RsiW
MSVPSWSSSPCDSAALSAYLDGELDASSRAALERHLVTCERCRGDLDALRELSQAFVRYPYADLTAGERSQMHETIDAAADAPVLRLGGMMGLIAASILVVSSAWLVALPPSRPITPGAGNGGAMVATAPPVAPMDEWERIATSLRVDAPRAADDQVYLAEANLDEWMLKSLEGPASPAQP